MKMWKNKNNAVVPYSGAELLWPAWDKLFEGFFNDGFFGSLQDRGAGIVPAVDVSEKDNKMVVKAEVPGMEKDAIRLRISDGVLTISGEKKYENCINVYSKHIPFETSRTIIREIIYYYAPAVGWVKTIINIPDGVMVESYLTDHNQ